MGKELVGRALEHKLKKQPVRVQIGNHEASFTYLFSDLIKDVMKDKYQLILGASDGWAELKLVKKDTIDILILIINNLWTTRAGEDSMMESLQFIAEFKTAYGKPVIAFCAYTEEDCPVIAKVKLAADFYFQLPFNVETFMEAFEKCLEMLHSFDEVPRKRLERLAEHTTP